MAESNPKFTFQLLDGRKYPSIQSKESLELMLKWSMKNRLLAQTFSFDQYFQPYQKDDFVKAFLQDPSVLHCLEVVSDSGQTCPISVKADSVTAELVSCSALSMSYFDRLYEHNIVRESGNIRKCFDEYIDDFTISDELRKMLMDEDSDDYDLFSEGERDEFLFRMFKHICLGGSVCQYEDNVSKYLDITKQLYKDLISVQKDPSTSEMHVTSTVFKITGSKDGLQYYPSDQDHEQNFAYLIIDPLKRHVNVLYHKFGSCPFENVGC